MPARPVRRQDGVGAFSDGLRDFGEVMAAVFAYGMTGAAVSARSGQTAPKMRVHSHPVSRGALPADTRFVPAPHLNVNEPSRIISWNSTFPLSDTPADVQSGDDGLLDVGEDSFLASDIDYTGYVVEFGGETYAIFSTGSVSFIP